MNRIFYIAAFLFFLGSISKAQNNNSPYSIIGIGDIETSHFDRSTGMGNTGVALSGNRYLFQSNPASYCSMDDHFFHFEVASRYKDVAYSGTPISNGADAASTDLQFKKVVLAIKLRPRWGFSLGLLPFSTANYSFYSSKQVVGDNYSVPTYVDGSGSTNQFYIANSYALNNHISVGLHLAYIFGQFSQNETIYSNYVNDSTLITTRNNNVGSPFVKLGVQYKTKLNEEWNLAFGATGSLKTKLNTSYQKTVKDGTTVLTNTETDNNAFFTLPTIVTTGVAATLKDKFTFAADYNFQSWGNLNYKGFGYVLVNSNRFAVGAEYAKKLHYREGTFEKYFFQTGFYYNNSYLQLYNHQISDIGASFGAGFNAKRSTLGVSAALQIGTKGTTSDGLIKENYTNFSVTISYRDLWFMRKKRYD